MIVQLQRAEAFALYTYIVYGYAYRHISLWNHNQMPTSMICKRSLMWCAYALITIQLEIFTNFDTCSHLEKKVYLKFSSCVKDCIAGMVTFTAAAKIWSFINYCNTR